MGRSQTTRLTKWAEAGRELPIRAATTDADAGIIGAAAAVAQLLQGAKQTAPEH